MLRVFGRATDQLSRDVIAVTALTLGRPLDIQRLTVFIEQLACKRTARRCGLAAFTLPDRLIAQPLLNPIPERAAHYRLVLPRIAFLLVADLAPIDRIWEQVVKRSAREWV